MLKFSMLIINIHKYHLYLEINIKDLYLEICIKES